MKLNLIDKAFLLKKISLFESLDLDLLLTIADRLELTIHRPGEFIFRCHQEAHQMYFIVSGRVLIQEEKGNKLAELLPHDFFGDEALFHETSRAYQAISIDTLTLLSLSRAHLFTILLECPSVAISLLEAYTHHPHFRTR